MPRLGDLSVGHCGGLPGASNTGLLQQTSMGQGQGHPSEAPQIFRNRLGAGWGLNCNHRRERRHDKSLKFSPNTVPKIRFHRAESGTRRCCGCCQDEDGVRKWQTIVTGTFHLSVCQGVPAEGFVPRERVEGTAQPGRPSVACALSRGHPCALGTA